MVSAPTGRCITYTASAVFPGGVEMRNDTGIVVCR